MFNDLLKATMKQEGITGRKLAELLGDKPALVSYYLQKGSLDETTMSRYADALGYDVKIELVKRSAVPDLEPEPRAKTPTPKPARVSVPPQPVPQTPPPYYVDYTKEQVQQWKRFVGTDSAPMPPDSPDFKLFKQFLDDFEHKRTITFKEG